MKKTTVLIWAVVILISASLGIAVGFQIGDILLGVSFSNMSSNSPETSTELNFENQIPTMDSGVEVQQPTSMFISTPTPKLTPNPVMTNIPPTKPIIMPPVKQESSPESGNSGSKPKPTAIPTVDPDAS